MVAASDFNCVICQRVADGPTLAQGAEVRACPNCGQEIWVSPRTLGYVAHSTVLICLQCAHAEAAAGRCKLSSDPLRNRGSHPLGYVSGRQLVVARCHGVGTRQVAAAAPGGKNSRKSSPAY